MKLLDILIKCNIYPPLVTSNHNPFLNISIGTGSQVRLSDKLEFLWLSMHIFALSDYGYKKIKMIRLSLDFMTFLNNVAAKKTRTSLSRAFTAWLITMSTTNFLLLRTHKTFIFTNPFLNR